MNREIVNRSSPFLPPFLKYTKMCIIFFGPNRSSGLDDLLGQPRQDKSSRQMDSEWDMLKELPASKPSSSSYGAPTSRSSAAPSTSDTSDARKKFGNAKAISSDQFFQDANGADVSLITYIYCFFFI